MLRIVRLFVCSCVEDQPRIVSVVTGGLFDKAPTGTNGMTDRTVGGAMNVKSN
jgi:hypothetical protein